MDTFQNKISQKKQRVRTERDIQKNSLYLGWLLTWLHYSNYYTPICRHFKEIELVLASQDNATPFLCFSSTILVTKKYKREK